MKIRFSNSQINFFKFLGFLISLIPLCFTVIDLCKNYQNASAAGVVIDGVFLLVSLYIAGITGSILYTGNMATNFVDFIFYPRRYLKTPPVITTRQRGLISARQYAQAESELCDMRLEHPESPDVALMLAELHASEAYRSPETAIADILYFFRHRRLRYHRLNLTLTMRCADFYQKLGYHDEAFDLLAKEAHRKLLYTLRERTVLADRANTILEEHDI